MRKLLLVSLVLVLVLPATPVLADAPMEAFGSWDYEAVFAPTKVAGNNLFVSGSDEGTWTGTFVGTSVEEYVAVFHKKHGTYQGLMTFTGCVDEKCGELVIKTNGSGPFPIPVDWSGTWVILSGTGELANLHGQGTWYGDLPNLTYEGKVHFSK